MQSRSLPYLLLLPATLFLVLFFLYPFFQVAIESVTNEQGFTFEHFGTMASHWKFSSAFWNTILLALIAVPIQIGLSLFMASIVTRMNTGRDIILYIWTIPLGISDLAAGLIWLAILEQNGFFNSLFFGLGMIDQPMTILGYQNKGLLLLAVVLAEVWRATAIVLVILVAGMGLIPKEYSEAAEVFGASPWKRFYKITLPLLRPSLQTALILRTILAFEVFAVVAALAGTNLPVLMGETYTWQFDLQDRKVAAAFAMVILGISIAFTIFFMWALRVPKEAQT
ncbi:MAG: carbohydrate ABC transporter permease [Geminicoccaceae bacterium]